MSSLPVMKSCPHCGGNPVLQHEDRFTWSWVECFHCGAAGPKAVIVCGHYEDAQIKAIEAWNRRYMEGSS